MEDSSVVLASNLGSDRSQRDFGEAAAQIHSDLAGLDNLSLAGLREDGVVRKIEILAYGILDP